MEEKTLRVTTTPYDRIWDSGRTQASFDLKASPHVKLCISSKPGVASSFLMLFKVSVILLLLLFLTWTAFAEDIFILHFNHSMTILFFSSLTHFYPTLSLQWVLMFSLWSQSSRPAEAPMVAYPLVHSTASWGLVSDPFHDYCMPSLRPMMFLWFTL